VKLIWKFNIAILAVAAVAFILAAVVSYTVLHANARDEVLQNARVMMESANASGDYINAQVRPLLETQLKYKFIPQSVPAFAATEQFNELRKNYPDYTFKAATLNPTNPRNRAADWEADVVSSFRNDSTKKELVGQRQTATGEALFLAKPLRARAPCLECHSVPRAAPVAMVRA
jgi:protein-histidine pros-kinase